MAGTIETPRFRYTGMYYPQILQDLLVFLRQDCPEITDEDPHEPFIQILRGFGLVGHYSSVLTDHVALETLFGTSRLRESVKSHLRLIAYELAQASPASAVVVARLTAPLTSSVTMPGGSQFATPSSEDSPSVIFELIESTLVEPSSSLSKAFEYDAGTLSYIDRTTALNAGLTPFSAWSGVPAAGDALYLGHSSVLPTRIDWQLSVLGDLWGDDNHALEYHDGHSSLENPDSVTDLGGGALGFDLTSFLGDHDRQGSVVRITCRVTGISEDVATLWDGSKNEAETTSYLGQVSPSSNIEDYLLSAEWREVLGYVETAPTGTAVGRVSTYVLPWDAFRRWVPVEVNGVEAYWLRLRVVRASLTSPTFVKALITEGGQYLPIEVAQGLTEVEDPAGSSLGTAGQKFVSSRGDVIGGTVWVEVNEGAGWVEWSPVGNFLSSSASSRHYVLTYDDRGRAEILFGDGTSGMVPPVGTDNIRYGYRYGATEDGNVGAGAISQNRSGISFIASVTNPAPASGYRPAAGSTKEDLARVKVAGPASLRTRRRALTAEDCVFLSTDDSEGFVASSGAKPVVRAQAIEELFGPKTIGLYVVGAGGAGLTPGLLTELATYFNGDPVTGVEGVLLLNSQLRPLNYTPVPVSVSAVVTGGDKALIRAALQAFLNPLATEDGEYIHSLEGATLFRTRIISEIFKADPGKVKNVVLAVPVADIVFGPGQLPVAGTLSIT